MSARNILISLLSVTLLLVASPQAAAQAASQAIAERATLEEVVVTARKIEENLQDTPISISAFSGGTLERRQIFSTETLDQVTPNLQFTNDATLAGNNAASVIFIRGIGQTDPTATVDPGVGMYLDDVYLGHSVGGTMDLRDIADAQVLRGPQGTLFGRNTIGGAILLRTVEPGDDFGGTLRAGYASRDLRDFFLAVDVPFTEDFKSRFSFGSRDQEGYVTRDQTGEDLGDSDTYTVTGKFVWTPTEDLEVRALFDYTHSDENGIPFVFAASTETALFQRVASVDAGCPGAAGPGPGGTAPAVPMIPDDRCANDFQNKGAYHNNGTFPLESSLENWGASLHLSYDLTDQITLKSITAYRELDWIGVRDADNTPLTILHTAYDSTGDQFTQEVQALYRSDALTGVVGFFYMTEEIDDIVYVELNPPPPGIQRDSDNALTENDNWAVFSQWTWNATDALALTFGARYTEDSKGTTPDDFDYANPSVKFIPMQFYEETATNTTISGSISYRWNENVMTYFSYSEGFKGGGWNTHFNRPQTPQEIAQFHYFGPEEAATFEIGLKLDLLDDTLRVNAAVFTTPDYEDLQFTYRVGVAPYLANAGKASIKGFELEATWAPTSNWYIETGVGFVDTSIDELNQIAGTAIGVVEGNALPFSPEWQANVGVGYTAALGGGWVLLPRADFSYQDKTFFDANNTVEIAQLDGAPILNLEVALEPQDGNWRLTGGVNNVTDETDPVGGNSSLTTSAGYAEVGYSRPREFFIRLSYDF